MGSPKPLIVNLVRHILITLSILLFSLLLFSSKKKEQGDFTFPNGANYKGELKDGIPNGQVTSTFPDGGKYVGEFKDGKRWNGTIYDKKRNIIEKWVNGVKQK